MEARRVRLLLLMPSLNGGGAESVTVTLLRHLDRRRFEPHLGLCQAEGPLLSEVPGDVLLHDLRSLRVRYAAVPLIRTVWKLRPDVVFTSIVNLNLLALSLRCVLPAATRVIVRQNTIGSRGLLAGKGRRLCSVLYARADAVICQSEHTARELAEAFGIPREKLVRIYNPVDEQRIAELATAEAPPLTGPGPHLVAVGRLEHVKGYDLLLEALLRVRRRFPSTDLTVFGSGPMGAELRRLADSLRLGDAVQFAGFSRNPFPCVKRADCFVVSSRCEGLPNAMLEAAVLGTPIVATRCPGGVPEILEGVPGAWLAEKIDAESIADALCQALCSGRAGPRRSSRHILQKVNLRRVVHEYESLLAGEPLSVSQS